MKVVCIRRLRSEAAFSKQEEDEKCSYRQPNYVIGHIVGDYWKVEIDGETSCGSSHWRHHPGFNSGSSLNVQFRAKCKPFIFYLTSFKRKIYSLLYNVSPLPTFSCGEKIFGQLPSSKVVQPTMYRIYAPSKC